MIVFFFIDMDTDDWSWLLKAALQSVRLRSHSALNFKLSSNKYFNSLVVSCVKRLPLAVYASLWSQLENESFLQTTPDQELFAFWQDYSW